MEIPESYAKAYAEVLEIVKHLKPEEYNRIPKEVIEVLEENKSKDHKLKIDKEKEFTDQLSPETKGVLSNLYRRYVSTEEDRRRLNSMRLEQFYKEEKKKKQKYPTDPKEIFRRRNGRER